MIKSSFFSSEEKDIIKLIAEKCSSEPVCVLDFLKDNFFVDNALLYNPKERKIALAIPVENKNAKKEIARLWDLFTLFRYLDDNSFTASMPFDGDKQSQLKCIWNKAQSPEPEIKGNDIIIAGKYIWSNGQIYEGGKPIMQCYMVPDQFYNNFELLFKYTHATKRLTDLIECNFKSFDELTLEELKQQSLKLEELAKEIRKQSNELKTQSKEAKNQSDQLEIQSNEAKSQSEELKSQSREAKKQSIEASRQSKEAKCQTKISVGVIILTLITGIITTILSSCDVTLDPEQEIFKKPISVIDSSLNLFAKDSINQEIKDIKNYSQDIRLHQNDSVIIKSPLQSKEANKSPQNRVPQKAGSRSVNKAAN